MTRPDHTLRRFVFWRRVVFWVSVAITAHFAMKIMGAIHVL